MPKGEANEYQKRERKITAEKYAAALARGVDKPGYRPDVAALNAEDSHTDSAHPDYPRRAFALIAGGKGQHLKDEDLRQKMDELYNQQPGGLTEKSWAQAFDDAVREVHPELIVDE